MASLLEYYTTNYTRCARNQSIFESPRFLSIGAKLEAVLVVPVNVFGIYCILWHTPHYMRTFRWHLLHLHCWLLFLTVSYTLLTTPYHFYPAVVRCSVGVLRELRVPSLHQLYLINLVYAGIVCAIILLFQNRHHHLVPPVFSTTGARRARRVLVLGVFSFVLGNANNLPVFMHREQNEMEQERMKLQYLGRLLPCPNGLFFDECSYAQGSFDDVFGLIAVVSNLVNVAQLVYFVVHSLDYIRKARSVNAFSERTKRLQKAFFKAALAQVAAPVSVLAAPFVVLVYIMATGVYAQGLINLCILSIPAHTIVSTAALLVFNAPYRKFVRHSIFRIAEPAVALKTRGTSSW